MTKETEIEKRIEALMTDHEAAKTGGVARMLEDLVRPLMTAVHPDVLAYGVIAHATGLLAAMKMGGVIRPELADLLADDLSDTVKRRAVPGIYQLGD